MSKTAKYGLWAVGIIVVLVILYVWYSSSTATPPNQPYLNPNLNVINPGPNAQKAAGGFIINQTLPSGLILSKA